MDRSAWVMRPGGLAPLAQGGSLAEFKASSAMH